MCNGDDIRRAISDGAKRNRGGPVYLWGPDVATCCNWCDGMIETNKGHGDRGGAHVFVGPYAVHENCYDKARA